MKLNQVIAIEKGVKSQAYSKITELDKICQKPDLFKGFAKTYKPKNVDSEDFPPENKKTQFRVQDVIKIVKRQLTELFDVTAAKDWANCSAVATVTVGSKSLLEGVPVTYLLFLEKQLTDLRTLVGHFPELDENEQWEYDAPAGLHKTAPVMTHKQKKVQKPIVMYDATKEHPAQTQLITEDVLVGYWETVHQNGGVPTGEKEGILDRIDALLKAVKQAREEANSIQADVVLVGQKVMDYVLGA